MSALFVSFCRKDLIWNRIVGRAGAPTCKYRPAPLAREQGGGDGGDGMAGELL